MSARRVMLVTGLSGAGKSTALRTLEDIGWETVDNLPLGLLERLLDAPAPPAGGEDRPLAMGIDSRTRGFDPARIVERVGRMRETGDVLDILFLDCAETELQRRFSETRRRHPLAPDRPAEDGIARERELLFPLRQVADPLIDTTDLATNELQQQIRALFSGDGSGATLSVMSFGFTRGVPRNADFVFDMRFLRNPHWDPRLRPQTGLDAEVAAYVASDPAHDESLGRIVDLLTLLLPRYESGGRSYLTIAFGCTGGRHRSVHVAETVGARLRARGFSLTILHRDVAARDRGPVRSGDGTDRRMSGG